MMSDNSPCFPQITVVAALSQTGQWNNRGINGLAGVQSRNCVVMMMHYLPLISIQSSSAGHHSGLTETLRELNVGQTIATALSKHDRYRYRSPPFVISILDTSRKSLNSLIPCCWSWS
jgi:hypothetical protein